MGTATTKYDYGTVFSEVGAPTWTWSRPNDTTAYASGDVIGETGGVNAQWKVTDGGRGFLLCGIELIVNSATFAVGATRLHLYNGAPTAIADNAVFDVIAADRDKYLGYWDLPAPVDLGSTGISFIDNINAVRPVSNAGGLVYGVLETRGAFTPTAQISKSITLYTTGV